MPIDNVLILKKLKNIEEAMGELSILLKDSDDAILNNFRNYHTAERLFQLIVDSMVDSNVHIIRQMNLKADEDLQSTFRILGENGILSKDFALKLAPVVGLRNRVVHRYESLSRPLFIKTLREGFSDFKEYALAIEKIIH